MTWVTDLSHFIDAQTGNLPTNVPGAPADGASDPDRGCGHDGGP